MAVNLRKSFQPFSGRSAQSLKSSHDEVYGLLSTIKGSVKAGSKQLRDVVSDGQYKGLVEYIAWDLLPILGPHLSHKEKNEEIYNDCVQIVLRLAELGNPKEMFIGILEQLDRFLDSLVHNDLLEPLQTVIRRLGLAKPLYYNQLLTSLYSHMERLSVPSVNGMGAMERRLIGQDADYSKMETTTLVLLEFLVPMVRDIEAALVTKQLSHTPKEIKEIEATRTEIMKFVLNILDHPLIAIEFKYQDDADEEAAEMEELGISEEARQRVIPRQEEFSLSKKAAEQCMLYLDLMGCSFSYLLLYASQHPVNLDTLSEKLKRNALKEQGEEVKDETLPVLGLSCFSYMVLVEGYQTNRMPSVYSAVYMMQIMMPYIEAMLRRTEEPILCKGLELLRSLVDRLDDLSLNSSVIDIKGNYLQVSECLVQIMVYCSSKLLRRMSVAIVVPYMNRFDWKGRHHMLRSLLSTTRHPGARGILIGQIKEYIHITLQCDEKNSWFIGRRFADLCSMVFRLDHGIRTDLLHSADKEIASLNFLRYLLLRDSGAEHLIGIWLWIEMIQEGYLNPLQTCLSMSLSHYRLKVDSTKKEIQEARLSNKHLTGKLTVAGKEYPPMPLDEQVKVLENSLYTIELIDCVLSRVNEIIAAGKNPQPAEGVTVRSSSSGGMDGAGVDSVTMDT
ncbi:glomulin-like [Acanthaster planci]|uniref:Glomulin-like n=1 Tax=Acanthaster planci TaxID=133434 RepID=A0A8B7XY85_ACAPL|nr:glomulin-like [Acanthaster planci]